MAGVLPLMGDSPPERSLFLGLVGVPQAPEVADQDTGSHQAEDREDVDQHDVTSGAYITGMTRKPSASMTFRSLGLRVMLPVRVQNLLAVAFIG
jgi:hypothetical protein